MLFRSASHRDTRLQGPWSAPLVAALALFAVGAAIAVESVEHAIQAVSSAFRTGETSDLRPLLPSSGKIFVSLPSVSSTRGYLDADPFLYLLDDILDTNPTVSFASVASEKETERARWRVRWEIRVSDSNSRSVELGFLFSLEDGNWVLREIRESYRA